MTRTLLQTCQWTVLRRLLLSSLRHSNVQSQMERSTCEHALSAMDLPSNKPGWVRRGDHNMVRSQWKRTQALLPGFNDILIEFEFPSHCPGHSGSFTSL